MGLTAVVIVIFSILLRAKRSLRYNSLAYGALFGLAATAAMFSPAEVVPGVRIDGRYVMLIIAAPFGGTYAALMSLLLAGTARFFIGGQAMFAGIVGIALASALSIIYRKVTNNRRDFWGFCALGILAFCPAFTLFILPFEVARPVFETNALPFLIANFLGVMIAGKFLCLEVNYHTHLKTVTSDLETDALTKIGNRYLFDKLEYNRFNGRASSPFAILLIDIDHFKNLNDRYGHDVGDRVLQHIAAVISSSVRETDLAIRYGGEEFVVIMPNATIDQADRTAARIQNTLRQNPFPLGRENIGVTFSAGVSASEDGASPLSSIVKKADQALYQAKDAGRDAIMKSEV
ncbi:hypothetical protein AZF01_07775 [Martelella sp. AD-3]|nr:hypothetical protein AZF01_07775 [Martelella sp. AD-3]